MASFLVRFLFAVLFLSLFSPLVASLVLANRGANTTSDPSGLPQPAENVTSMEVVDGWVGSPNGRGTMDIVWSSISTILLCSWTVLCLNVTPPHWSRWRLLWQKFLMTGLGALGPEFILQLALTQWTSARHSVRDFHNLGYNQWTMTHAFLADMGGFSMVTEEGISFPLDGNQVFFLVKEGYVHISQVLVDRKVIEDRNKGDKFVRFLTVVQILWFTANSIGRLAQNLAITTIELTTLGFIVCTLGTYYFWAHKPMDILTSINLSPNIPLREICERHGRKDMEDYKRTPLDFVPRDEWESWMLYWTYWMNMMRALGIVFHRGKRPIEKIPDDHTHSLSPSTMIGLIFFHTGYAAIHLCGWNFHFPSPVETTLWRFSTIVVMTAIIGCWVTDIWAWRIWPAICRRLGISQKEGRAFYMKDCEETKMRLPDADSITDCARFYVGAKLRSLAARLRNNSPDRDPDLEVPLRAIIPVTFFALCYAIARCYILLEDVVNLRSQPASAYLSVNWQDFFPHL